MSVPVELMRLQHECVGVWVCECYQSRMQDSHTRLSRVPPLGALDVGVAFVWELQAVGRAFL